MTRKGSDQNVSVHGSMFRVDTSESVQLVLSPRGLGIEL